jgi:hypothetical protein
MLLNADTLVWVTLEPCFQRGFLVFWLTVLETTFRTFQDTIFGMNHHDSSPWDCDPGHLWSSSAFFEVQTPSSSKAVTLMPNILCCALMLFFIPPSRARRRSLSSQPSNRSSSLRALWNDVVGTGNWNALHCPIGRCSEVTRTSWSGWRKSILES